MIYCCENKQCGFLFSRSGEIDRCPDCGSSRIHPADEQEQAEFLERVKGPVKADDCMRI
jgi:rubrerythrin